MGFGIKTRLLRPFQPIYPYRLASLRRKWFEDTSQHGESLLLQGMVKEPFPHTIVDVGANDGELHSNSFYFIRRGWRGLLIEPNPEVFEKLQARYRDVANVECVNAACSREAGTLSLFLGADEAAEFSTLNTERNKHFQRTLSGRSVSVSVVTLTELLASRDWPADFGILSIDTESFDYEVLQGLDFSRFRPRIIITENFAAKDAAKARLLRSNDYKIRARRQVNTVWCSK